jgi:hypothetical protein
MDDGEWCERIKRRLVALHLAYPLPHELTAAMRATAHALAKGARRDVDTTPADRVCRARRAAAAGQRESVRAVRMGESSGACENHATRDRDA